MSTHRPRRSTPVRSRWPAATTMSTRTSCTSSHPRSPTPCAPSTPWRGRRRHGGTTTTRRSPSPPSRARRWATATAPQMRRRRSFIPGRLRRWRPRRMRTSVTASPSNGGAAHLHSRRWWGLLQGGSSSRRETRMGRARSRGHPSPTLSTSSWQRIPSSSHCRTGAPPAARASCLGRRRTAASFRSRSVGGSSCSTEGRPQRASLEEEVEEGEGGGSHGGRARRRWRYGMR